MHRFRIIALSLLFTRGESYSADAQHAGTHSIGQTSLPQASPYFFTTKDYQREALRAFLAEINCVARDLRLPEVLPITESNLVEVLIATPGSGMIGSVSTSNYTYYARAEHKFAGLDQSISDVERDRQRRANLLPISLMDTNAAFLTATQIMARAGMDILALNKDCTIDIEVSQPNGPNDFVPDYWITWRKSRNVVAFLILFEQTQTVRSLSVWDPGYILRKPIVVPNLGELLRNGNAPQVLLERLGLTNAVSPGTSVTAPK